MIENRNEYTSHLSQHQQDMNINFRRQNVFQSILKKDVQVYQDNSQQSQMLEQMKIPLNIEELIQIPEWLDIIYNDYCIPLKQAQYINIWDPVENHYIDITTSRSLPSQNFKNASPIYIRYLPYQENAVPPHANFHCMIDENNNNSYNNSNYNPLYQTSQNIQNLNNSSQGNWYNQPQQNVQTHSNNGSIIPKSSNLSLTKNQNMNNTLSYQRTNSDVTISSTTSGIQQNNSSSIRSKRQSVAESSKNCNYGASSNNIFSISTHQNNTQLNDKSQNYDNSSNNRKIMDQLKQEASSSSPCDRDENVLKNLKMEDQGPTFASTLNNTLSSISNAKCAQLNLKREDTQEMNDNMTNSGELNNFNTSNNNSSTSKYSNGKPRHKDSDQLSQKDTCPTTQQSDQQIKNHKNLPREKRVKERQISYVKGKVDEWRNLYDNGRITPRGEIEKVNLDVAASLVGLSRKTLDDYYAQLRKAQKYGFDFDSNSSEKMGTLRKYVKKMSEKDVNAGDDDSQDTDNNTSSKSNFNTPQLKPSIPSDILKQELSMSVGHPSNSRKYSDNNLDLIRQSSIPLKHNLSAPPQQQQSLLNQIKIEHTNYSLNNINTTNTTSQSFSQQQQKQSYKPIVMLSTLSYETTQFKIENPNFDEKANDTCMNLENIESENNMCNVEPMEEEEDNFTDYINSENNNDNPKQEQNDDQFN